MPRYVALLRGVGPTNARMPQLQRCFEDAGFTHVRTLLGSGNVVFDARSAPPATLARRAEKAMSAGLGRSFGTTVRSLAYLQAFLDSDPYGAFRLAPGSKCVVTFLRAPAQDVPTLPIERDGARVLACLGSEVLSAYVPGAQGPVFMRLLERHFGTDITTRTLDTVRKCAAA